MKQFARVSSSQPSGLRPHVITVEVDVCSGAPPSFSIVGMPDKSVDQAQERVIASLRNMQFPTPYQSVQRVVVSMVPSDIKKEGAYYDVAIALGYLLASGSINFDPLGRMFVGELSLNGDLLGLTGVLPIVLEAKRQGFSEVYVPMVNVEEAGLVAGIVVYGVRSLIDLVRHLDISVMMGVGVPMAEPLLLASSIVALPRTNGVDGVSPVDFSHIRGQELAKRALLISAVGRHNIALYGPPGTGKTLLARGFVGILPQLDGDSVLEVTSIHSIAGVLDASRPVVTPPFRSPHHTSSYVSVVGGGQNLRPGEITLAHKGVLFLDEFPEFDSRVIESLRQPLEDRIITISRAKGTVHFPADCILIIAMNPCPCGYQNSGVARCTCNAREIARYQKKLSGPIVDRIDLWSQVMHVDYELLTNADVPMDTPTSEIFLGIVSSALEFMHSRATVAGIAPCNKDISVSEMAKVGLEQAAHKALLTHASTLKLSPRSVHRVIRVARTIADLTHSEVILREHISEALQYRPKFLFS